MLPNPEEVTHLYICSETFTINVCVYRLSYQIIQLLLKCVWICGLKTYSKTLQNWNQNILHKSTNYTFYCVDHFYFISCVNFYLGYLIQCSKF